MAPHGSDVQLIERALARDPAACRALVDRLTPAIQRQVNAALVRRRRGSRQDVLDLTQEVFRILLDEDGRILRGWDPKRGATLEGWVGMVAERRVLNILTSGRQSGHAEDAQDPADFDQDIAEGPTPELQAISKQQLSQLLEGIQRELSDQGFEMFRLLFVEQRDVAWIMEHHQMSRDAVYAWRSRIRKTLMKVFEQIESDPATEPGRKQRGAL
ncbi:MAG: sigma-70 family RNA polymerase sigma factor [Deltaproteobacteria bacterium]